MRILILQVLSTVAPKENLNLHEASDKDSDP